MVSVVGNRARAAIIRSQRISLHNLALTERQAHEQISLHASDHFRDNLYCGRAVTASFTAVGRRWKNSALSMVRRPHGIDRIGTGHVVNTRQIRYTEPFSTSHGCVVKNEDGL
ncbi:hypothetical protein, partial [Streptomyces sp. ZL-24]|uniref:hypothetical protein n=1 Tax=Streptomyces sp. ZL-24 TaxID=1933029 RepID=UPI0019D4B131